MGARVGAGAVVLLNRLAIGSAHLRRVSGVSEAFRSHRIPISNTAAATVVFEQRAAPLTRAASVDRRQRQGRRRPLEQDEFRLKHGAGLTS
jgi:hypothetical protein